MNDPDSWPTPAWHPDWGNPATELELLRSLAKCAQLSLPNWTLELQTPEEGYMNLRLCKLGGTVEVEVHMVERQPSGTRYAVFCSGPLVERYFDSADEAVRFIASL